MPNPNLYLYANYNRIFLGPCTPTGLFLVKSTDLKRLLCWGIPGLPTLTVLPWVSWFQCKSHSVTATQGNLMSSPFCCVTIYRCWSNGASDTDFLCPGKNVVWCWEQSPDFAYHRHIHETKPHTHKLCEQRLVTLFMIGVAYEWFH